MKILMLVPFLPNTETSGGQTRWYNIIKYMSKTHEITLFSLIKDDSERKFIKPLEKYCKKVEVFKRTKSPWHIRNLFLAAVRFYPLLVVRNWSPKEQRAIKEELKNGDYDLIHAETFYVMPHIPETSVPSVMVEQTIEYQVYKHYVETNVPKIFRPIFMFDVIKLQFWEKYFWQKATRAVAVSVDDREIMQDLVPGMRVDVIPNGVDSSYYEEKKIERSDPPRILYGVSNFEWLQNQEAVEILIEKVWPIVAKKVPGAKLWVVGRKMPGWLKEAASEMDDLELTENIPDARDAYRKANLMVAPIKGAGGTRLKVLEAMAAGLPIVSTSIGMAGLGVSDGKHAIIADTYEQIANEAVNLLNDDKKAEKIGQAGREFVKKNYDWKAIVKLHEPIYEEVTKA